MGKRLKSTRLLVLCNICAFALRPACAFPLTETVLLTNKCDPSGITLRTPQLPKKSRINSPAHAVFDKNRAYLLW